MRAIEAMSGMVAQSSPASLFPDIFSGYSEGKISLKRVNGTVDNATSIYSCLSLIPRNYIGEYNTTTPAYNANSTCIAFGSGNTPVTFNDYKLEEPFLYSVIGASISSANLAYESILYDSETDSFNVTVRVMVSNKSSAPITIREYGFANYYYYYFREVLVEPITIAAGETVTFRYTVNIKVPEV
jgi:hypothetical protein